jgi:hypothetical protein
MGFVVTRHITAKPVTSSAKGRVRDDGTVVWQTRDGHGRMEVLPCAGRRQR